MPRMGPGSVPFRRRGLSLTALIDMVFLLLLFFMLTTTFTRTAELPLVTGGAGVMTEEAAAPVFLRLSEAALSVNGQPSDLDEAAARIVELAPGHPRVLVSLTPEVTAQRLADLLVRLRAQPGLQVQVLG